MTFNDPAWSVFWAHGGSPGTAPTSSTLFTGKHVGQDSNRNRANETVGFIVVQSGNGVVNGEAYQVGVGSDTVRGVTNAPPYSYLFVPQFLVTPPRIAVVTQAGMDGGDGSWAYTYGSIPFTLVDMKLAVDEDQIGDNERNHTSERVGYFVFEDGIVLP